MIKLHNTATRQIEEITNKEIGLYTCGPTVYNYPQIGNWATFIRWDILVRVLQASGQKVNWVMNITDVGHLTSDADTGEDKLEKGARREGKTAWEVADFYTKDFVKSLHDLNILMPTKLVKATDHIQEQIDLIKKLEKKGFSYVIDDGVYFDTSKLGDYGKLAQLKLDDLREGARVEVNSQKRNPTDFALWKFSPKNSQRDMEWDSPWGKGFPGWHLECSAMAMKYLGETIDIHAGGIDHIPVHHTNEIAQSEAATDKPFVKVWVHGNFITVDGAKLSKSLGNSYTLHDIVAKNYDPLALRLLFLQGHYRHETNFTWESLDAATNRLNSLRAMADLRWQIVPKTDADIDFEQIKKQVLEALQNDLDTPKALAILSQAEQKINETLVDNKNSDDFVDFLAFIDQIFGLKLLDSQDITKDQKTLINQRQKAREDKNFTKADNLRDELALQNILLRDTQHGSIWHSQQ